MNSEESISLFRRGRKLWNAWARQKLAERKALEDEQRWLKEGTKGALTEEAERWHVESDVDFSGQTFSSQTDFADFLFPGRVAFEKVVFETDAKFRGALFKGDARFGNAVFKSNVGFREAIFYENAWFGGAVFAGNVEFGSAVFRRSAWFAGVTFIRNAWFASVSFAGNTGFGNAIFKGNAGFSKVIFGGNAGFGSAHFRRSAGFGSATFKGDAGFRKTTFNDDARFIEAAFSASARFESVTFKRLAEFSETNFKGNANFEDAVFARNTVFSRANFKGSVDFENATFEDDAGFGNATFKSDAGFENAFFKENAGFSGVTFERSGSFSGAIFKANADFSALNSRRSFSLANATFCVVPDFIQAHFLEAPRCDNLRILARSVWPRLIARANHFLWFNRHSEGVRKQERLIAKSDPDFTARWRALKKLAIQGHDHEHEQVFFRGELLSRRGHSDRARHATFWFGLLYQWFSDFGRSLIRPLSWLVLSLVIFAGVYINQHDFHSDKNIFFSLWSTASVLPLIDRPPGLNCRNADENPVSAAFDLSIRNALLFVGQTSRDKLKQNYACLYGADLAVVGSAGVQSTTDAPVIPGFVVFMEHLQNVVSAVLIFLFLLAVRNHFKIK